MTDYFTFGGDSFGYPAGSEAARLAALGIRPPPGSIAAPVGRMAFSPGVLGLPGSSTLLNPGELGIGRVPPLPQLGTQPFQRLGPINGLASQVPPGVGQTAATSALRLGEAASASGSGLLSRLPSGTGLNPGGLSAMNLAGRGAGGFALGSVGSSLIDQVNPGGQNSNLEQGLQGGAIGAGIGATLGAPLFGIGAVPGGLIGGAVGGGIGVLANMFGGGGDGEEADPLQTLATAMTSAQLTPDTSEQILQTYETLMALAEQQEGDAKDQARAMAFEQTSQMILQAMQQQQQAEMQAPQNAANTLALQAQAQQIFEPLAQDIETTGGLYAQAMAGIRDNLPESYRGVADATVARELTSADRLANAYRAQAAITPIAASLTQYQQDQSSYAQQMFQQALQQQMAGQTGTGSAATSDLLSQLVPT